jgi:hypothetical protein
LAIELPFCYLPVPSSVVATRKPHKKAPPQAPLDNQNEHASRLFSGRLHARHVAPGAHFNRFAPSGNRSSDGQWIEPLDESFSIDPIVKDQVRMKIYVGNLAYSVTDEQLESAFGAFGEVSSATVITDKFSGQSKGFGFVEMPDSAAAAKAIQSLNGTPISGRNVKVNEAKPREDRPQRPRY